MIDAPSRAVTIEEYEAFLERPENADRLFERIDGVIVEKMPNETHGIITVNLIVAVGAFVEAHKLGRLVNEVRYRPVMDQKNDRIPDIAFTTNARMQAVVEQGAVPTLPDLVIEVQSPSNTLKAMREKAAYYLEHGVRMAWLVLTKKKLVEVYRQDEKGDLSIDILTLDETLEGYDVLPGFTLPLKDIFAA